MMVEIPLAGSDRPALIDECDRSIVEPYSWYLGSAKYAVATVSGRITLMHRLILAAPKGTYCDHANHDPLDNRRANIRLCTPGQNSANRRVGRDSSTGIRGVFPDGRDARYYRARVTLNGKKYQKLFKDIHAAAAWAENMRVRLFAEFSGNDVSRTEQL